MFKCMEKHFVVHSIKYSAQIQKSQKCHITFINQASQVIYHSKKWYNGVGGKLTGICLRSCCLIGDPSTFW